MTIIPISERRITAVEIEPIKIEAMPPDGAKFIAVNVRLMFEAFDGTDHGITAVLDLGVPADDEMTIGQIERAALDCAHELLSRLGRLTRQEIGEIAKNTFEQQQKGVLEYEALRKSHTQ